MIPISCLKQYAHKSAETYCQAECSCSSMNPKIPYADFAPNASETDSEKSLDEIEDTFWSSAINSPKNVPST